MKPDKTNKNYQLALAYLQQLRDVELQLSAVQKKEISRLYLYFLRKAAYAGSAAAQFELSGHYEDLGFWGMENPFYNPKEKLQWLLNAAAWGSKLLKTHRIFQKKLFTEFWIQHYLFWILLNMTVVRHLHY